MEELAPEVELACAAVERITGDREADRLEMDADLMRAPGLEPDVEEGVPREQLDDVEMRHGVARRVRVERVPERIVAVAADRRLDPSAPRARPAADKREVVPLECAPTDEPTPASSC